MTALHAAASSPEARELVAVVLAEFDRWLEVKYPARRRASRPDNLRDAERSALLDMREELADHLIIPIGVTVAVWKAAGR